MNYCSSVLSILKKQHTCDWSKSLWQDPLVQKNISNWTLLLVDQEIIDVPYLKICRHTPCCQKTGLTEYRMFCGEILILAHFQFFLMSHNSEFESMNIKVIKGNIMRFKFSETVIFFITKVFFYVSFRCYHHLMFS